MHWGVDIGSTYTKIVGIDKDGKIIESSTIETLVNQDEKVYEFLNAKHISSIVATGYGRNLIKDKLGAKVISEIQAHAKATANLFEDCSLIIELGGQDSKVIQLENGQFVDFRMNDKCAAGTGKFLEIAANRLGFSLDEFGDACMDYDKELEISSMCAVFAESELISLMAKKESAKNIGAAVHASIASRLANMSMKFSLGEKVVFSGGGAKNSLLKKMIEEKIERKMEVAPNPQIMGAYGAAIEARLSSS
jgi:(R)-2-hydroxyacyl-CoA dehydratese activating ATPase